MSALTKTFVVLLVVSSIAFATMTVSIATKTTNWREVAQRFEDHARVADTNLRNLIAANAAELASASDAVRRHLDTISGLEGELARAQTAADDLGRKLARAEADNASLQSIHQSTLALLQSSETERDQYRQQRDNLENQSVELQRRNIDLNDRVNELTASVAVLIEQNEQYQQQINVLRGETKRLSQRTQVPASGLRMEEPGGAPMPNVRARDAVATAPIRGSVVDISGDIVTISVGTADGVEREMVFVIHRNGEYVGDLRISAVEPRQAAGRLMTPRAMPSRGDQVTDALSLSSTGPR